MLIVEFLARTPPAFWQKGRTLNRIVPVWHYAPLAPTCGYLSCVLRYDTPSGNTLYALNRSDICRYVSVDEDRYQLFGAWAFEHPLMDAAADILPEINLYIELCDIAVFGHPLVVM